MPEIVDKAVEVIVVGIGAVGTVVVEMIAVEFVGVAVFSESFHRRFFLHLPSSPSQRPTGP